jgi:hypothetical protein
MVSSKCALPDIVGQGTFGLTGGEGGSLSRR